MPSLEDEHLGSAGAGEHPGTAAVGLARGSGDTWKRTARSGTLTTTRDLLASRDEPPRPPTKMLSGALRMSWVCREHVAPALFCLQRPDPALGSALPVGERAAPSSVVDTATVTGRAPAR